MIAHVGTIMRYSTHHHDGGWHWALDQTSEPFTWDWHGPYSTQDEAKAAAKLAIDTIINQVKAEAEAQLKEVFGGI